MRISYFFRRPKENPQSAEGYLWVILQKILQRPSSLTINQFFYKQPFEVVFCQKTCGRSSIHGRHIELLEPIEGFLFEEDFSFCRRLLPTEVINTVFHVQKNLRGSYVQKVFNIQKIHRRSSMFGRPIRGFVTLEDIKNNSFFLQKTSENLLDFLPIEDKEKVYK